MKQTSSCRTYAWREFYSPTIVFKLFKNLNHHLISDKLKELLIISVDNFEVSKQPVWETNRSWWFYNFFTLRQGSFYVICDLLDWFITMHHLLLINHVTHRGKIWRDVSAIFLVIIFHAWLTVFGIWLHLHVITLRRFLGFFHFGVWISIFYNLLIGDWFSRGTCFILLIRLLSYFFSDCFGWSLVLHLHCKVSVSILI